MNTVVARRPAETMVVRNPKLTKTGLAAVICFLLFVAGLVAVGVSRPWGPTAGPLVAYRSGLSAATMGPVGHSWSWSLIQLENPTEETIHLDSISVEASDSRFIGGVLVEQWRTTPSGQLVFPYLSGDGGTVAGWPPSGAQPGDLVAPSEAVIQPHKKVYVYIRLVPPAEGRFLAGPAEIDYHIASDHYQVTSRNWETICAPAKSRCPLGNMPY